MAITGKFIAGERTLNPLESGVRRGKNFLNSLIFAVLGLILFFLIGPYLFYASEFQYTAENFAKASAASFDTPAEGYVYLWGKPELDGLSPCMVFDNKQCIYFSYKKEMWKEITGERCGTSADAQGVEKISQNEDKCSKRVVRKSGRDVEETVCEKCWTARWHDWTSVDTQNRRSEFMMGATKVVPGKNALYKAYERYSGPEFEEGGERYREQMDYLLSEEDVLAVGEADKGVMSSGDPFIISLKDFKATSEQIAGEQSSSSLMLKVGGFLCLLIGLILILSPIATFIEIAGAIPWLGDVFIGLSRITGIFMFVGSLVIAVFLSIAYTILFMILRMFVDNIIVAILVAALFGVLTIVGFGLAYTRFGPGAEGTVRTTIKPLMGGQAPTQTIAPVKAAQAATPQQQPMPTQHITPQKPMMQPGIPQQPVMQPQPAEPNTLQEQAMPQQQMAQPKPIERIMPTEAPQQQVMPTQPVQPINPQQPVQQEIEAQSAQPSKPVEPLMQDEPEAPQQQATQEQPEKPSTQQQPNAFDHVVEPENISPILDQGPPEQTVEETDLQPAPAKEAGFEDDPFALEVTPPEASGLLYIDADSGVGRSSQIICGFFEKRGFKVSLADSLNSALDKPSPKVAIVDIEHEEAGLAYTLNALRQRGCGKIIIYSDNISNIEGVDETLKKSDIDALVATVSAAL